MLPLLRRPSRAPARLAALALALAGWCAAARAWAADVPTEPAPAGEDAPPDDGVPEKDETPLAAPAPPARDKLRWLVVPNLSYDSDDKLGFGARAEVVQPKAGLDPYKSSFVVHAFLTTNGYHHHRFRFDLVGLGKEGRDRVTGHFAFRAWLNDGYWGVGNGTEREVAYEDAGPDDPDRKRYRYSLIQPFGQVALRHQVVGPLSAFGSVNVRYSLVDAEPGALLTEHAGADGGVVGMDGGLGVQLIAGMLWDTREPEVTPDRGWVLELSARGVTGAYTFGGPFASVRAWGRLAPGIVLGQRIMGEWLLGDVPFYEMVHWGGSLPIAGFGGADTLRGMAFGRWRAPGKAIANTELRIDVLRHTFLKQDVRWQLVPFVDVGTVWGAGDPLGSGATAPAPALPIHPTAGGGVRVIWAETLVGRVDAGVSQDLTDEGDALEWGLYLMFDHMF